jgi:hypothetical protein
MNKLHVGVSPLTNRIFAGRVTKNGLYWREGKEDVTGSACAAVAEHALASKKPVVVFAGGKPCFEISVRDLRENGATQNIEGMQNG